MEGYQTPQSPLAVNDPRRHAAWDGYITLITTLLPTLRSGHESRPGELAAAWKQLAAAVDAAGSEHAKRILSALPPQPSPDDLAPLTEELGRIANVRLR